MLAFLKECGASRWQLLIENAHSGTGGGILGNLRTYSIGYHHDNKTIFYHSKMDLELHNWEITYIVAYCTTRLRFLQSCSNGEDKAVASW